MTDTEIDSEGRGKGEAKFHRLMIWLFGFVVFAGGAAFFYKLYEFFLDLSSADGLGFAGSHLLTYCLVAGGFLLLLAYGFITGHFTNIEEPKHSLMEMEENYDREEYEKA